MGKFFFFFLEKIIVDFIQEKSRYVMEKIKNEYSSNQIMDSSSSFTLTRANVAQLYRKSILISSLIKNTI